MASPEGTHSTRYRVIRTDSQPSATSLLPCPFDGARMRFERAALPLRVHEQDFLVVGSADVCQAKPREHVFHDPQAGDRAMRQIATFAPSYRQTDYTAVNFW